MATVQPQRVGDNSSSEAVKMISWSPLTTTNSDGGWFRSGAYSGLSLHLFGTFGGTPATVAFQGSNEEVPTSGNAVTLSSYAGTALTATAKALLTTDDMPLWVRPVITGGDGTTAITAILAAHRRDIPPHNG